MTKSVGVGGTIYSFQLGDAIDGFYGYKVYNYLGQDGKSFYVGFREVVFERYINEGVARIINETYVFEILKDEPIKIKLADKSYNIIQVSNIEMQFISL